MKKTLTLVLVLICACTSVLCCHAQAAEIVDSGTCGENVQWSLDADGVLTIWGEGDMTNFGYTSFGHLTTPWHNYGEDGVKSIIIGDGVTSIGDNAFDIMYSYEKTLYISSTVKQISTNAFSDSDFIHIDVDDENPCFTDLDGVLFNKELTTLIYYPRSKPTLNSSYQVLESVRIIEEFAFYYNENIMEIAFPSNLQIIGDHAFSCSALQSVEFPSTLESIGDYAFYMLNTETVNIPGKVSQIGKHAFYGSALSEMKFECDAPQNSLNLPDDIVLYYYSDKSGWTTPTWNEYACYPMGTSVPTPTPAINCDHIDDFGYALYGEILKTWKEYPYFGTAEQCYVVEYDSYICSGCGETATWHSDWYDDHVFGANGVCGNCGYTADGVYVGTEATSTPKPTNTPTAKPTSTPNCQHIDANGKPLGDPYDDVRYREINEGFHQEIECVVYVCNECDEEVSLVTNEWHDEHEIESGKCLLCGYLSNTCRLDELTDVDYLAFADISYLSFADEYYIPKSGTTIFAMLSDVWPNKWDGRDFTYEELYDHIKEWRVLKPKDKTGINGFYALAFINDHNEVVISYRGSNPPLWEVFSSEDAAYDWIMNDIPAIFGNSANDKSQVPSAIGFYEEILSEQGLSKENVALAGHSLGGALADIVSAYSDSHARSVNAISALDVAYEAWPELMSKRFEGVDKWNFYDILNELDGMAGAKDIIIKPASIHASTDDNPHFGDLFDGTLLDHSISNLLMKDISGKVVLTPKTSSFNNPIVSNWDVGLTVRLNLGTSGNNTLRPIDPLDSYIHYGGIGKDALVGSIFDDMLIGGKNEDSLDASWYDDIYVYNKGDGLDLFMDVAGKDEIYLQNFSADDIIKIEYISEEPVKTESSFGVIHKVETTTVTYPVITCNGTPIIKLIANRDSNKSNTIILNIDKGENSEIREISEFMRKRTVTTHYVVLCPVDIEILDENGQVVYVVEDEMPGMYYTDYGNFYVTPLENSTHCSKVLDLFEGYSIRIKGIGNGTMDISVYDTDGHTLFDPVGAEDVIITPKTVATLEENPDTGKLALVVDNDGNGTPDGEIVLRPVHPNDDDHDQPLTKVDAVEPTCEKTGNVEYYICSCGKMFSDSNGKDEITDRNSVIIPLSEEHQYEKGVCKICGQKEINPDDLPQTGDHSRLGLWFALLAVSVVTGFCFMRKNIKA